MSKTSIRRTTFGATKDVPGNSNLPPQDNDNLVFYNANGETFSIPYGVFKVLFVSGGGITDPGSNGIIKRTALNTSAPAVAGTDYQSPILITTTGSSGAATLIGNTLNIPQYAGGGGGGTWGSITGTISSQTDLQTALNAKQNSITLTTTGTSGTATLSSGTLNIPQYSGGGGGVADPGANGIMKRTALNTTAAATAGTDYSVPNGTETLTNKTIAGGSNTISGLSLTTAVTGILPLANGGTGTTAPGIVAGTNITVSGTWPNQTINSSSGGSASGDKPYQTATAYSGLTSNTLTADFTANNYEVSGVTGNITIVGTNNGNTANQTGIKIRLDKTTSSATTVTIDSTSLAGAQLKCLVGTDSESSNVFTLNGASGTNYVVIIQYEGTIPMVYLDNLAAANTTASSPTHKVFPTNAFAFVTCPADTTEDTLFSYTLPANSLKANSMLRVTYTPQNGTKTGTINYNLKVAGTVIDNLNALGQNQSSASRVGEVWNLGSISTNEFYLNNQIDQSATLYLSGPTASTFDFSTNLTIIITAQKSVSTDVAKVGHIMIEGYNV